jgi:LDH2 family malate/lactate/ureidoglycolate dehydrogenase
MQAAAGGDGGAPASPPAGLHVVPTFASKPMLGTNPIAIAAPARR